MTMAKAMCLFALLVGSGKAFVPVSRLGSVLRWPDALPSTTTGTTTYVTTTTTNLPAKLWDRLEIEEDSEPFWYLLNCVAGLEMDLLRQCRQACEGMPDAIKFVVPTETKTRSHGAKRMVTETKVKYQGYVFSKLRLCPEVYETIQSLDLCRSWMGTVNHKGHRKLPPAPIALNEVEVENFGLEQCEAEEDEKADTGGIIVDVADEDAEDKIDKGAIKAYLGLKVEDMVKVTAKGKFFNEDGIIRRLKDGKILVRFYTYGTMFEEWLQPTDLRKLSNIEILKGLSGPNRPVTQRDFDGPSDGYDDERRPRDLRRNLGTDLRGAGPRNRRQDRNERRVRQDGFGNDEERGRNDRNWNWYQDQQQDSRRRNDYGDESNGYQAGSSASQRRDRGGDWAVGNVDSQWGRDNNPRPKRQDVRRQNQMADAALRGDGDWSAFVTPAGRRNAAGVDKGGSGDGGGDDDDDFFASLMNNLSSDLGSGSQSSTPKREPNMNNMDNDDDDDFFSSLLSDVSDVKSPKSSPKPKQQRQQPRVNNNSNNDEDFFAALEAELGSAFSAESRLDDSDDLFAKLEAELSPQKEQAAPKKQAKQKAVVDQDSSDDLFAELEAELSPSKIRQVEPMDDFFAELEADLDSALNEALSESVSSVNGEAEEKATQPANQPSAAQKPAASKKPAVSKKPAATPTSTPAPSSSAPPLSPETLEKQTVPVLKEMLRERKLKVSGNKAELIERLLQES